MLERQSSSDITNYSVRTMANNHAPDNPFVQHAPDNPFTQDPGTLKGAFATSALRGFANNMLAFASEARDVVGSGLSIDSGFGAGAESGPPPTVEGIEAGARALPALFPGGDTFSERKALKLDEINAGIEARREEFPIGAKAGDVAGDVATLMTGRLPLSKGIRQAEQKLLKNRIKFDVQGPGVKKSLEDLANSQTMRKLAKGAGRSTETGLEAAALDILKGNDQLETVPLAVGVQIGGSLTLEIGKGLLSGNKALWSAVVFGTMLQLAKNTIPGGENNLLSSLESGFEKVQLSIILGLAVSPFTGRFRGVGQSRNYPRLADGITTVTRGAALSFVSDYFAADEPTRQKMEAEIERTLNPLPTPPPPPNLAEGRSGLGRDL